MSARSSRGRLPRPDRAVGARRDDGHMLTDADRTILDLAGREPAYKHRGAFEQAVI